MTMSLSVATRTRATQGLDVMLRPSSSAVPSLMDYSHSRRVPTDHPGRLVGPTTSTRRVGDDSSGQPASGEPGQDSPIHQIVMSISPAHAPVSLHGCCTVVLTVQGSCPLETSFHRHERKPGGPHVSNRPCASRPGGSNRTRAMPLTAPYNSCAAPPGTPLGVLTVAVMLRA
jgi:hypothetical protein